jgi:xanthine dehydrogenase YagR molybdenum-binding subunit
MPTLHVQKLRGKGGQEAFEVTEEAPLPARSAETKLATVGHRHLRVEGAEKVTDRARYTYDIRLPGQLYARVLRSPHPHARRPHRYLAGRGPGRRARHPEQGERARYRLVQGE